MDKIADSMYKIGRKILYKELQPLFEAMSSIRYAVVKGEVLSQQIYGEPDLRRPNDIDILIDKKNVKFLEELLCKFGFEQKLTEDSTGTRHNRVLCMTYSHQIPSYHKDKFGFHLNVDINYDIFWGEYEGKRCFTDDFLRDTVDMEIYGVNVKALPIEKAFVQLILHHYKEMNSIYHLSQHNCIRTDMFKDIYNMLQNNLSRMTIEHIKESCEFYMIGEYIYYLLYYTNEVFKDSKLDRYLFELQSYKNHELLETFGLSKQEKKRWKIPFISRLDNVNLPKIVKTYLSENDIEKVKNNIEIFG